MSDDEAFDLCHPDVRQALRSSVFQWSAGWALGMQRKHGTKFVITLLREADMRKIRKQGWFKDVKSPIVSYRLKPLYP